MRKRQFLKTIAGTLGLALTLGAGGARAEDTLKFGVAAEPYPPFTTQEASGKWVGFEVDLMDAVCARMKRKCVMVGTAWDGIIPALNAKKFDVIWSSMTITDERRKQIDFSTKYYQTPAAIIGPKATAGMIDFKTLALLDGKTIGAQVSTIHAKYVEKHFPKASLKTYDTQDNCNADLVAGRIDFVMADSIALADFLKSDQGKAIEVKGIAPEDKAILGYGVGGGFRKSDTKLREAIDKAIDEIRADGEYAKIQAKYFDFDVYGAKS